MVALELLRVFAVVTKKVNKYKMDKSEKYDIKEASNPGLTASARKNYADNAESNAKGPKMYDKGPKMESNAQEKKNLMKSFKKTPRICFLYLSALGDKNTECGFNINNL